MPKSHQISLGLLVEISQGAGSIWVGLYLQFMSRDYTYGVVFGILLGFCSTTMCLFYVKESPKYLIAKGKRESAFLKLKQIASQNDKLAEFEYYLDRKEINTKDSAEDPN